MKKILCFGDSNIYGFDPSYGTRYDEDIRWSGILKEKLAQKDYKLIEAGGNNRKCFIDNNKALCGYKLLPNYLKEDSYDIVILALGINDIQKLYKPGDEEIQKGMKHLIQLVKKYQKEAKIIILSPSHLSLKVALHPYFSTLFNEWSIEKSKEIFDLYEPLAKEFGCDIINLNKISKVSDIDGLHYDKEGHKKVAEGLYDYFINLE